MTRNDIQNQSPVEAFSGLKPYKKDFGFSYSCGVFPTCELAAARPETLKLILVTANSADNAGVIKLKKTAGELRIPFRTDDKAVARIYPKENVYAVGVFAKNFEKPRKAADHVVLVNPVDMGNLGTIMRTMAAFEIFDLALITPCCDVYNPKTVRASMGAVFRLRISEFDSFEDYKKALAESGDDLSARQFFPFMLDGCPMEEVRINRNAPATLIFGNEAAGLPESFLRTGKPVRIMHADTVDSLNLPVAAAIGIYNLRKSAY
ncbi:MAG: TrmH family RNA methyltransferase [Clostridia bacterium]|nr:TrmH family RNA methyltransferase [Clostridia bacterium]